MSPSVNKIQSTFLPPAPITQRMLAMLCDLILLFLLNVFIVGKLWLPLYHAEAMMQFQTLLETYSLQLLQGHVGGFFAELKNSPELLHMFQSLDWLLFWLAWGYYAVNGCFFRGGTLGKQIFNLRVLKLPQLKPLSFFDNIWRSGTFIFFLLTGFPFLAALDFFWACVHRQHRGLHDLCCQTYVVNCTLLEQIQGQIGEAVRAVVQAEKAEEDTEKSE